MTLRQTPLYDHHADRNASFTDFGGWDMPVEFSSIRTEHEAVRTTVGVFDVSHMGELAIDGPGADELCQRLVCSNVDRVEPGQAQYTSMLAEDGTIIDDAILYRLSTHEYLLIPNAGKDELVTDRLIDLRDKHEIDAKVENQTEQWGMIAVQGPESRESIPAAMREIERQTITKIKIDGVETWCARTGYTGEEGYELLVPWDETPTVDAAIEGERCGLGARDTLRLEMGFVLAGNEFDQDENRRTPYEAGLDFIVDLDVEPPFVGSKALREQQQSGLEQRLSGLVLEERGIPRHGYEITDGEGTNIGMVTSGTMSPTLGEPIGLGYIDVEYADAEAEIAVSVRGTEKSARIVTPPFVRSG